jgi:bifunctional DNase/RNase
MAKVHQRVELEVTGITHGSNNTTNYSVLLTEIRGNRRLPVVIGAFEAQAIALAMEKMTNSRPMTHDLFKNVFDRLNIELREVIINDLVDGVFHSVLVCEYNGHIETIDSRTSDAIALAMRFKCPIHTFEFIMEASSIVLDEEFIQQKPRTQDPAESLHRSSLSELEAKLAQALEREDYKLAARIRDEINRR